jgi:hypothetical protein
MRNFNHDDHRKARGNPCKSQEDQSSNHQIITIIFGKQSPLTGSPFSLELAFTELEKGKNQEEWLSMAPTTPFTQELAASIDPGAAPISGRCPVEWPINLSVKYNPDLLPFRTRL